MKKENEEKGKKMMESYSKLARPFWKHALGEREGEK